MNILTSLHTYAEPADYVAHQAGDGGYLFGLAAVLFLVIMHVLGD